MILSIFLLRAILSNTVVSFFKGNDASMKILFKYCFLLFLLVVSVGGYSAEKGDPAISIPVKLLEDRLPGKNIGIGDYRGKLIYVDFWASWCGPCRKSLPILNEIRNQFVNQGFEVVAINVDENLSDALGFLDKYPVDYPVLLDPAGQLPRAYRVKGMPTAYLIDENGKIIYKHMGFKTKDRKKIEKLISGHIASR
jgi:thiol-disulfide isomerase/thioredoxin